MLDKKTTQYKYFKRKYTYVWLTPLITVLGVCSWEYEYSANWSFDCQSFWIIGINR